MSGIIIDVDTKSNVAKQDLSSINKSLAEIARRAHISKGALNNVADKNLNGLNKGLANLKDSFANVGKTATPAMHSVAKGADNAKGAIDSLKRAAVSLGTILLATAGVSAFNKVADDLTNIQNRIKLVVSDFDEVLIKQKQL